MVTMMWVGAMSARERASGSLPDYDAKADLRESK
jgi:hypothetical protein